MIKVLIVIFLIVFIPFLALLIAPSSRAALALGAGFSTVAVASLCFLVYESQDTDCERGCSAAVGILFIPTFIWLVMGILILIRHSATSKSNIL